MDSSLLPIRTLIKEIKNTPSMSESVLSMFFSSLVYFSDKFIWKVLRDVGAEGVHIITVNGLKAFRTQYKGRYYVAFRGTESSLYSNWKRILNFLPKKTKTGRKAHRGFVMAFEDCQRALNLGLIDPYTLSEIVFCGHSLGGAMALLAADQYRAKAFTFAAPKVFFNEKLPTDIPHVSFRIVGDYIPHVPVSFFFLVWSRSRPDFAWMLDRKFINPLTYHKLDTYINYVLKWRHQGLIK